MHTVLSKTLQLYKDAWSGHRPEIWTLGILTLINRMGTMVIPFLTVYLTTVLGFSLREAGFLVGAYGLGSLGGTYLGGRLVDRIGPKPVILGSLLLSGGLLISLQLATAFPSLFALIVITAFFADAYRPALMAAVGDFTPEGQTGRSMAFIRLAINLGMSAAPAVGGFVALALGYRWLFWIDGLTCMAAALYFIPAGRDWPAGGRHKRAGATDQGPAAQALPPYRNIPYLLFLLASFLTGFAFVQWFNSVPVFIKTAWGYDEGYIGILLASSCALITLIEMPIIHSLEKAQKAQATVLTGVLLIGVSFLPLLLPKSIWLGFFGIFLLTMGEICFLPFNNTVPLHISPKTNRGDYIAWYWMVWSLVSITGPVAGLWFAEAFGWPVFWVALLALAGLGWGLNRRLDF